jgi:hypothetical protein
MIGYEYPSHSDSYEVDDNSVPPTSETKKTEEQINPLYFLLLVPLVVLAFVTICGVSLTFIAGFLAIVYFLVFIVPSPWGIVISSTGALICVFLLVLFPMVSSPNSETTKQPE